VRRLKWQKLKGFQIVMAVRRASCSGLPSTRTTAAFTTVCTRIEGRGNSDLVEGDTLVRRLCWRRTSV
jgi:hypothetical protein